MFKVNNNDWAYFTPCFSVSIVNFEHVIAGWGASVFWFSLLNDTHRVSVKSGKSGESGKWHVPEKNQGKSTNFK